MMPAALSSVGFGLEAVGEAQLQAVVAPAIRNIPNVCDAQRAAREDVRLSASLKSQGVASRPQTLD